MGTTENAVNPWMSVWTRPRSAMRAVLASGNLSRHTIELAVVFGCLRTLNQASLRSSGDENSLTLILVAAVLIGPFTGAGYLFGGAWLLQWTNRAFGGRAAIPELRAALAWPQVISIPALALYVPDLLILREELFRSATPRIEGSTALVAYATVSALAALVFAIWSSFATVKCVAEVQQYSAWNGLGHLVLMVVLMLLAIMIISIPLALVL